MLEATGHDLKVICVPSKLEMFLSHFDALKKIIKALKRVKGDNFEE